jgi:hypothetical protein
MIQYTASGPAVLVAHPGGIVRAVNTAEDVRRFVLALSIPVFGELSPAVFDQYAGARAPLVVCAIDTDMMGPDSRAFLDTVGDAALANAVASGDESASLDHEGPKAPRRVLVGRVDGVRWSDFIAHYGLTVAQLPRCVAVAPDGSEYYPQEQGEPVSLIEAMGKDGAGLSGVAPGSRRRPAGAADPADQQPRDSRSGDAADRLQGTDIIAKLYAHAPTIVMGLVAIAAFFVGRRVAPQQQPEVAPARKKDN